MSTKTFYACSHVYKYAEVDDFQDGCQPDTRICVMDQSCSVLAPTLVGLIEAIGKMWYLDMDDVFLPNESDDEPISYISYNRQEDANCLPPSDRQIESWKAGKCVLYLAGYDFTLKSGPSDPSCDRNSSLTESSFTIDQNGTGRTQTQTKRATMNKQEKRKFIQELTNSVRDAILAKVEDMPEEWNGIELRRYIAEQFQHQAVMMSRKSVRDYNTKVYNCNLSRI